MMNKQELIKFEEEISDEYCAGNIKAPIHLSDGNEDILIDIFKNINTTEDYVFSTWRSHYHALLKGIPRDLVKQDILNGKSITLCYPEYKFFTSAIVGGIVPIALGVALGLKLKGSTEKVWVFIGDMTAETGGVYEAIKYASNNNLPIHFVVEDNDQSVGTPTQTVWNQPECTLKDTKLKNVTYYSYKKKWPHVGSGKWVTF